MTSVFVPSEIPSFTVTGFNTVFSAPSYGVALNNLADRLGTEMMVEYFAPGTAAPGEVQIGVRIPGAHVKGLRVSKGALQ